MQYPDYLFIRQTEDKKAFERVKPWKWTWKAQYSDGSELEQFEEGQASDANGNIYKGIYHQIAEVDQSKLETFIFQNIENGKSHSLKFNPAEMKLICFYQTGRQFIFTNEEKGEGYYYNYILYNFGYEKNINGKTYKTILKILPDDSIVVTDDKELMIEFN